MKKSGFTLIELSIVLVIIGLIVGGVLVGWGNLFGVCLSVALLGGLPMLGIPQKNLLFREIQP